MKSFAWILTFAAACAPQLVVTGGAGGTGGGGTGGGGTGGTVGCTDVIQCPPGGSCATVACLNAVCSYTAVAVGSSCVDDATKVCDAAGSCVACVDDAMCVSPDTCVDGTCVPAHCTNKTTDPGETGVDCGGGVCSPCPNGETCNVASDCKSNHCPAGTCEACAVDSSCPAGTWCDLSSGEGLCVPTLGDGFACGGAAQCTSGFCVDGVCCDQACDKTCVACRGDFTGVASGLCQPIPLGEDPELECGGGAVVCAGSTLGIGSCNGAEACATEVTQDCKPYLCSDVGCWTICEDQTGCVQGYYCDVPSTTCLLQLPSGDACTDAFQCQSGFCDAGFCQ